MRSINRITSFAIISLAHICVESKTECTKAINYFADRNAVFERCLLQHSAPNNIFCEKCVDEYRDQYFTYADLLNAHDTPADGDHVRCTELFLEKDRFNLLDNHYKRSMDTWNDAHCNDCFVCDPLTVPERQNISTVCPISQNATDFLDRADRVHVCFQNMTKNSCQECSHIYKSLETAFSNWHNACFDLEAAFAKVSRFWYDVYACEPSAEQNTSKWAVVGILSVLVSLCSVTGFFGYRRYMARHLDLNDMPYTPADLMG